VTDVLLPPPLADDAHKGDAGRVLCFAGSARYPGAARLCVEGAARGGAGLVTLAHFDPTPVAAVVQAAPEVTYLDLSRTRDLFVGALPRGVAEHRHDVRVAGPGLGQAGHTPGLLRVLLADAFEGPLVLDADALNVSSEFLGDARAHPGPVLLTPHPGEAARLLGHAVPDDAQGRKVAARTLAERAGAVCVLKGRGTVVSDGERCWTCSRGNPGMATAGSGDVLAGLLGAFCCAVGEGYSAFEAARAAVEVHACAGDLAAAELGRRGLLARDGARHLPGAQREVGGA